MTSEMTEYRLYFLDTAGHIVRRRDFEFEDDLKAIAHVRQYVDGLALELWTGGRVVTRMEPKPKAFVS